MIRIIIWVIGFCICAYMVWLTFGPIINAMVQGLPF